MAGEDDGVDTTEVEWQFDALDLRPVERWLAALPSRPQPDGIPTLTALAKPARRLVDLYMDTGDWRIGRAGYVLRTRTRGRAVEVTMKDTRPADEGGLRERLEVTEVLPAGGLAVLGDSGPVGRRVAAVVGRRALVPVLEVRTRRQPFSLRAAGSEVAEVALDDTVIMVGAGQRPVQLRRVEVEVDPGWVATLGPLVGELRTATGLRPAVLSKFEAGLLAAGIEIPGPPELGQTQAGPGSSFGDLAFAVIRRHLRTLLAREPGTRLGEDIEELHDMRVATRRLRAAFDLFAEALPTRAQVLRAELRWLADALGAVRDLDVQLDRMDQMARWIPTRPRADGDAPLDHLRALLEAERASARRDLLDALDSPRWERLAGGLVAMARQGPNRRTSAARAPAAVVVPDLVAARHRTVVKAARRAGRSGAAADYHRIRIRCKRLRYSLEFTDGLYGGSAQRFVRKLTGLQDALGSMQDAEVASTRLYDLAVGARDPASSPAGEAAGLPPATVFVMGGVAEHYRQESEELRRSMGRRLDVLGGKAWDDLQAVMDRARNHATPVPGLTGLGAPPRASRRPDAAPGGSPVTASGRRASPVAAPAPDATTGTPEPAPDAPASSGSGAGRSPARTVAAPSGPEETAPPADPDDGAGAIVGATGPQAPPVEPVSVAHAIATGTSNGSGPGAGGNPAAGDPASPDANDTAAPDDSPGP